MTHYLLPPESFSDDTCSDNKECGPAQPGESEGWKATPSHSPLLPSLFVTGVAVSEELLDRAQTHRAPWLHSETPGPGHFTERTRAPPYLAFLILPWCSVYSNLERKMQKMKTQSPGEYTNGKAVHLCFLPYLINSRFNPSSLYKHTMLVVSQTGGWRETILSPQAQSLLAYPPPRIRVEPAPSNRTCNYARKWL